MHGFEAVFEAVFETVEDAGELENAAMNLLFVDGGEADLQGLGDGGGVAVAAERDDVEVDERGTLGDELGGDAKGGEAGIKTTDGLQAGFNRGDFEVLGEMLLRGGEQDGEAFLIDFAHAAQVPPECPAR